jgi:hypothetical protein
MQEKGKEKKKCFATKKGTQIENSLKKKTYNHLQQKKM